MFQSNAFKQDIEAKKEAQKEKEIDEQEADASTMHRCRTMFDKDLINTGIYESAGKQSLPLVQLVQQLLRYLLSDHFTVHTICKTSMKLSLCLSLLENINIQYIWEINCILGSDINVTMCSFNAGAHPNIFQVLSFCGSMGLLYSFHAFKTLVYGKRFSLLNQTLQEYCLPDHCKAEGCFSAYLKLHGG